MGRVVLFRISNLCVALVALVGLAVYTADTQAGRSEPCQLRLSSRVVALPAKSHARKDDPGLRFARLSHPLTGL